MYFFIVYNQTGKGHDRLWKGPFKSKGKNGANAFRKALAIAKKTNPHIERFSTFYVVPYDIKGYSSKWDEREMHGWARDGRISYPAKR